jgi:hypothetical protein
MILDVPIPGTRLPGGGEATKPNQHFNGAINVIRLP